MLLDNARAGKPISLENYLDVFNILILIALLTFIVSAVCLKETFCKSSVDFTILRKRKVKFFEGTK